MLRHPAGRFEINGVNYRPEWPRGNGNMSDSQINVVMRQAVETADELYSDIDAIPKIIHIEVIGDKTRIAMLD